MLLFSYKSLYKYMQIKLILIIITAKIIIKYLLFKFMPTNFPFISTAFYIIPYFMKKIPKE